MNVERYLSCFIYCLLSILLLDPGGHVHAPGDGHEEGADDVLWVDRGGRQLVEDVGLVDEKCARDEGDEGEGAEERGGDLLAHAQHGGGGRLAFPVRGASLDLHGGTYFAKDMREEVWGSRRRVSSCCWRNEAVPSRVRRAAPPSLHSTSAFTDDAMV